MRNQAISRSINVVPRLLLIICMLANLNACTAATHKNSSPIPKFKSVAIVNKGVTSELKARFGAAAGDSHVGIGAASGAAVGAAGAALACGPFVFLCALAVINFAAAGAAGGSLAGAVANKHPILPYEQLLALDKQFVEISQQRTINVEIEKSLIRKIPTDRRMNLSDATALLQYRLYDIRFDKTSSRRYALTLKTVMLFKWDRENRPPSSSSKIYEFTSIALQIEEWVQDEGRTLNQAFDACIEGLVEEMIKDIQFE